MNKERRKKIEQLTKTIESLKSQAESWLTRWRG